MVILITCKRLSLCWTYNSKTHGWSGVQKRFQFAGVVGPVPKNQHWQWRQCATIKQCLFTNCPSQLPLLRTPSLVLCPHQWNCLRYPLSTHHLVFFLTLFTLTFNISPLFTNAHINIPSSPALMAISISPKPPYLPFYSSLPSSFSLTLPLKPKSWQALHLSLLLSLTHTHTHIH